MPEPTSYLVRLYPERGGNEAKVAEWLDRARNDSGVNVRTLVVATLARGIDAADAPPGNGQAGGGAPGAVAQVDLAAIRQVIAAELETQLSRYALSGQAPPTEDDGAGDMGDVLAGMLIGGEE